MLGNRQAEPGPAGSPRLVGLEEALEDMRQVIGDIPIPVSATSATTDLAHAGGHDYAAARRGELDGIVDDVHNYLPEAVPVGGHFGQTAREPGRWTASPAVLSACGPRRAITSSASSLRFTGSSFSLMSPVSMRESSISSVHHLCHTINFDLEPVEEVGGDLLVIDRPIA